jgi:hypothetical protein
MQRFAAGKQASACDAPDPEGQVFSALGLLAAVYVKSCIYR